MPLVVAPFSTAKNGAKELPITSMKMTRFWLRLEQAVEMVIEALTNMHGGELYVKKIPSMRMPDLAAAIAPGLKTTEVGIRPGEKTREYIDNVLTRLTFWGGIYISIISVLPMLLIAQFNVPFYFGGTSLLILVGVAIDFMGQVESHLISQQYGSLMGKANRG